MKVIVTPQQSAIAVHIIWYELLIFLKVPLNKMTHKIVFRTNWTDKNLWVFQSVTVDCGPSTYLCRWESGGNLA